MSPQTGWCLRGKKTNRKKVITFTGSRQTLLQIHKGSDPLNIHLVLPTCVLLYSVEKQMPWLCSHKQPVLCGEGRRTVQRRQTHLQLNLCAATKFITFRRATNPTLQVNKRQQRPLKVKNETDSCGTHGSVNNLPQAARQSIWRGSFSKIGTGSYASCILKQYRLFNCRPIKWTTPSPSWRLLDNSGLERW